MKKNILLFFLLMFVVKLFAQGDLGKQQQQYLENKRDIKAVSNYYNALLEQNKRNEASAILSEYYDRCPVVQVADKDSYLLLSHLMFKNPYSNEFEYAVFAYRKMCWDRVETSVKEGREAMLNSLMRSFGAGVSKKDEVDKRYEVYSLIKKTLSAEIRNMCFPSYKKGSYAMPIFEPEKIEILKNHARKMECDDLLLQIAVAKAIADKNYVQVVSLINLFSTIGSPVISKQYQSAVYMVIADNLNNTNLAQQILDGLEKSDYNAHVLSKYYLLVGDTINSEKSRKIYEQLEAESRERFGDIFKALEE